MLARSRASEAPATAASSDPESGRTLDAHTRRRGFSALEAELVGAGVTLLVVTAPAPALEATAAHVERRLAKLGARVVRASSGAGAEGFRLALAQLGAASASAGLTSAEPPSAREAAAEIVARIGDAFATRVVVADPSFSRYASAVAKEIEALRESAAHAAPGPAVVWVTTEAVEGFSRTIALEDELDEAEAEAWWEAAASIATPRHRSLRALDAWWQSARLEHVEHRCPAGRAAELLGVLSVVGRPWPENRLAELVAETDRPVARALVAELVALGAVEVRSAGARPGERVLVALGTFEHQAPTEVMRRASAALRAVFADDPWAVFRAAELSFAIGDVATADELAQRAIADVVDGDARADFWSRLLTTRVDEPGASRLLGYVSLGLFTGDGDIALRFAREAAALEPDNAEVLLSLGKCHAAMGDVPAATVAMQKAAQRSSDPVFWARVDVELAELKYRGGDLMAATAAAEVALERLADTPVRTPEVQLDARNVLGKVLLAQGAFADAELHFAADACEASLAKCLVAELRARVNRSIAALYLGRRAEAQAHLEAVVEDAMRRGEAVRTGHALLNLAVIATLDHRYVDALELTGRAIKAALRAGERLAFAKCAGNLAELRVRLGLLTEAEEALRFGASGSKGALPGFQLAYFSVTRARINLARDNTALAEREVMHALSQLAVTVTPSVPGPARVGSKSEGPARGPGREVVSQAFCVAARIALEEGDTARARVFIENAAQDSNGPKLHADIALLRGMLARALGEPFAATAGAALDAAREANDIELLRECHLLLYRAARADGDVPAARHHLLAAASYRDRVALDLPETLRASFLARRELMSLEREVQTFSGSSVARPRQSESGTVRLEVPRANLSHNPKRTIVGDDPAVASLRRAVGKVAPSDATILIQGESGSGKELVADALHEASARRSGPLVKVNCAALVETLLLSELFGHEKGSFTGAAARRRGRFEAAEGGTLFLDEIGDISPRTQVALLRVLQEKTFERVGGTTPIRANVRIVTATHRNLKELVARGEFREDLYYRLAGVVVDVPPLRSRLGDLAAIADAILTRIAVERGEPVKQLSSRTLTALKNHAWPGNVRELENALRTASLFAESDLLEPEDFAENVESLRTLGAASLEAPRDSQAGGTTFAGADALAQPSSICAPSPSEAAYAKVRAGTSLHDMKRLIERECIEQAFRDAGGNITRAAVLLGMKRPRLSQLIKQYGLGGAAAECVGEDDDELVEEEA